MDGHRSMNDDRSIHTANDTHLNPISDASIKGTARHTLGLLLLLCVVVLWTAGSFLGSSIFADDTYAKPFFMTYLNTGIFVFMLVPGLSREIRQRYKKEKRQSASRQASLHSSTESLVDERAIWDLPHSPEREALFCPTKINTLTYATTAHATNEPTAFVEEEETQYLDLLSTARLSLVFCFLWFAANYFTMASLQFTTVASATILTSTSSVWTLLVGVSTGTERFTWRKLCGVVTALLGVLIISRMDMSGGYTDEQDDDYDKTSSIAPSVRTISTITQYFGILGFTSFPEKTAGELVLGDALALFSAIMYGVYTIVLKRTTLQAQPRSLHMPTFFGLVGVFNLFLLLPAFPILHFTGAETFDLPPTRKVWVILITNAVISLGSDVLWAYAMVFTSPLLVTVGLSLTIPLSLVGEIFIQSQYKGWPYWLGAMVVICGFVFVEREEVKEEGQIAEDFMRRSLENSQILGIPVSETSSICGPSDKYDYGGTESSKAIYIGKQKFSDDLEGMTVHGRGPGPSSAPGKMSFGRNNDLNNR